MRRRGHAWLGVAVVLIAVSVLVHSQECRAGGPAQVLVASPSMKKISLGVGKSVIVKTKEPIKRVSLASDAVADYVLLSPTQVYLTGKAPGITNMTFWDSGDKIAAAYDVEVAPDISRLQGKLQQVLPMEKDIRIDATHDSLALSGMVSSTTNINHALAVAEAYNPNKERKVINLMQVGGVHQVMLEVKVAEMSRVLTRRLGINFAVTRDGSIGTSLIGNVASVQEFVGSSSTSTVDFNFSQTLNTLFHIAGSEFTWTQFMDALKEDGLVKILAEPTLITLSGQKASFLAGGEFPVPIPQGLGTVAIEYKPFGVGLSFTPSILSSGKINVIVEPEVSELDFTTAIVISGVSVPGLTTRRVSTVVELGDGQSFAIAGLLRDNVRETVSKFPFLGELPILGPLFRSSSFQRSETELVVIVTPHLVKPLDTAKVKLPTDSYVEPDDCEFFFKGLLQGQGPAGPPSPVVVGGKAGFEGEFGHSIPQ